jgi:hypothetical protein
MTKISEFFRLEKWFKVVFRDSEALPNADFLLELYRDVTRRHVSFQVISPKTICLLSRLSTLTSEISGGKRSSNDPPTPSDLPPACNTRTAWEADPKPARSINWWQASFEATRVPLADSRQEASLAVLIEAWKVFIWSTSANSFVKSTLLCALCQLHTPSHNRLASQQYHHHNNSRFQHYRCQTVVPRRIRQH